jgi:hypothetical protein
MQRSTLRIAFAAGVLSILTAVHPVAAQTIPQPTPGLSRDTVCAEARPLGDSPRSSIRKDSVTSDACSILRLPGDSVCQMTRVNAGALGRDSVAAGIDTAAMTRAARVPCPPSMGTGFRSDTLTGATHPDNTTPPKP